MSDLLDRAMRLFFEISELEEQPQKERLAEICAEDMELGSKVKQILHGDRAARINPEDAVAKYLELGDLGPAIRALLRS